MVNLDIIFASAFFGLIVGFPAGLFYSRRKNKKAEKESKDLIEKQNLKVRELGKEGKQGLEAFPEPNMPISEPGPELNIPIPVPTPEPAPTPLEPCLICGKMSETNTCSQDHYNQALQERELKNQTHLSEGSHEPKKEEETISEASASTSSPKDPKEEKDRNQKETIAALLKENEELKSKKK